MRSIAFLSQKGGSGKTTLAAHISVAAGEKVILIDLDPQASASAWAQARKKEHPKVLKATTGDLARLLHQSDASIVIIDTPPHAQAGSDAIARLADLIVIPCRPSVLDLAAVASSVNIVRASGKPAAFVLNAVNSRVAEVGQARKALERYGYPICPVEIGNRQAYSRALASGSSVTEFEPKSLAAQEINALWEWIGKQLEG
jgi:chromosome partitioning protein